MDSQGLGFLSGLGPVLRNKYTVVALLTRRVTETLTLVPPADQSPYKLLGHVSRRLCPIMTEFGLIPSGEPSQIINLITVDGLHSASELAGLSEFAKVHFAKSTAEAKTVFLSTLFLAIQGSLTAENVLVVHDLPVQPDLIFDCMQDFKSVKVGVVSPVGPGTSSHCPHVYWHELFDPNNTPALRDRMRPLNLMSQLLPLALSLTASSNALSALLPPPTPFFVHPGMPPHALPVVATPLPPTGTYAVPAMPPPSQLQPPPQLQPQPQLELLPLPHPESKEAQPEDRKPAPPSTPPLVEAKPSGPSSSASMASSPSQAPLSVSDGMYSISNTSESEDDSSRRFSSRNSDTSTSNRELPTSTSEAVPPPPPPAWGKGESRTDWAARIARSGPSDAKDREDGLTKRPSKLADAAKMIWIKGLPLSGPYDELARRVRAAVVRSAQLAGRNDASDIYIDVWPISSDVRCCTVTFNTAESARFYASQHLELGPGKPLEVAMYQPWKRLTFTEEDRATRPVTVDLNQRVSKAVPDREVDFPVWIQLRAHQRHLYRKARFVCNLQLNTKDWTVTGPSAVVDSFVEYVCSLVRENSLNEWGKAIQLEDLGDMSHEAVANKFSKVGFWLRERLFDVIRDIGVPMYISTNFDVNEDCNGIRLYANTTYSKDAAELKGGEDQLRDALEAVVGNFHEEITVRMLRPVPPSCLNYCLTCSEKNGETRFVLDSDRQKLLAISLNPVAFEDFLEDLRSHPELYSVKIC